MAAAKSLQSCPTLCDPIDGSPSGFPFPGILTGKNTGMGCHLLLQCMKVKSESEVAQSCPTLGDPMDCSLPGSSIPGIFPGKSTGVGCHRLLLLLLSRFSRVRLCATMAIDGSPSGSPVPGILKARTLEWVAISFSSAWKWRVKVKSPST